MSGGPAGIDRTGVLHAVGSPGPAAVERAETIERILSQASSVEFLAAADGKSGAELHAVNVADRRYVLKLVGGDGDWVARASGDLDCRAVRLWTSGLLDRLPRGIEHAVVAADYGPTRRQGELLMRDVGPWLVPEGGSRLPLGHHRQFLEHMADLHASFWGFEDHVGLLPLAERYQLLSPRVVAAEQARGELPDPLPLIPLGLRRLAELAPRSAEIVHRVLAVPACLVAPLQRTPVTLLHGDWKAGNLGVTAAGETILLDWTIPGPGPACADLAWYLAINAARLPESKERSIGAYRAALEDHGIETSGWWDRQLGLSLIGAFTMLGWEKALGGDEELHWWTRHVESAAPWLE